MLARKMTRRAFVSSMGTVTLSALAGCGGNGSESGDDGSEAARIEMVADTGGINDQSFNQLAWTGLQQLRDEDGCEVSYMESRQDSDYVTNIDKAVDDECTIVWGIGNAMSAAMNAAAEQNPDIMFASIDGVNESGLENLTCVNFKSHEASFVVGYIAARMSTSGKVGFIGGQRIGIIEQFECGYFAGVEYANSEQGSTVTYQAQYAESFSDAAKGKSIAQKMIGDGCDVLFHAAGVVGTGMFEACEDAKVWSIGVDQDQAALFPDYTTIITSVLKRVDVAVVNVTRGLLDGSIESGQSLVLGAAEDAVGIPESHDLLPDDIYNDAIALFDKIKSAEIVVPDSEDSLKSFKAGL